MPEKEDEFDSRIHIYKSLTSIRSWCYGYPKTCDKLKCIQYFLMLFIFIYFNLSSIKLVLSLLTEFHLAHIKHVIPIGQYLSYVFFWLHYFLKWVYLWDIVTEAFLHIYVLGVSQNKG